MRYISTRGNDSTENAAEAICNGIARDGGLYVPERIPRFDEDELKKLNTFDYLDTAKLVFGKFLSGYSDEEITDCIVAAYRNTFDNDVVAPLHKLTNNCSVLELWHGPTSAFKDVALQMLPQLMSRALKKNRDCSKAAILVATSGDTGKAALEGFCDVEGTTVTVLFPREGVSDMQKMQMLTQRGRNVSVISVDGKFDDAQAAVKMIFADAAFTEELKDRKVLLSSANSINWGRLLPQIVYYVYVSAQRDDETDFIVPTGNFGNILACWYAKKMGARIGRLVCASNANDVLTDFLFTGTYNRRRSFYKTLSPSMDILVSSNLERLLFELSGHDAKAVKSWMLELANDGRYAVDSRIRDALCKEFLGTSCDDDVTVSEIREAYRTFGYLIDPHTAVAMHAYKTYREAYPQGCAVVVSTASPFKFPQAVYQAITGESLADVSDFDRIRALSVLSGVPIPKGIASLEALPCLHSENANLHHVIDVAENSIRRLLQTV